MDDSRFWVLDSVPDAQLRNKLTELLGNGSRTEARIIAHLAEVEQRRLHLRDGSESLYAYCIHVLHLSNNEAFHRITAARIARRFPIVFTLLEQRALHLTAVCLLRDYLTPESHRELLSAATHKTKTQVEELVARRFPRPDVQSRIRKLPAPRAASRQAGRRDSQPHESRAHESAAHESAAHESAAHESAAHEPAAHEPAAHESAAQPVAAWPSLVAGSDTLALGRDTSAADLSRLAPNETSSVHPPLRPPSETAPLAGIKVRLSEQPPLKDGSAQAPSPVVSGIPQPRPIEPLSDARYRIQLNASAALKQKLDRLRELTSHSNPTGDLALTIERAVDLAIEQAEKQRFAKTRRPPRADSHRGEKARYTRIKRKHPALRRATRTDVRAREGTSPMRSCVRSSPATTHAARSSARTVVVARRGGFSRSTTSSPGLGVGRTRRTIFVCSAPLTTDCWPNKASGLITLRSAHATGVCHEQSSKPGKKAK